MKTASKIAIVLTGLAAVGFATSMVSADPLPGQILKFQQKPMDGVAINGVRYYGHDEWSTARSIAGTDPNFYEGYFMADDFADEVDQEVVHVRWWGSYAPIGVDPPTAGVNAFLIAFEHDMPVSGVNEFSRPDPNHPDNLYQIVKKVNVGPTPAGTFTEKWVPSPVARPEELYEYNAELRCPFPQERDTVYWLKIVALVNPQIQPDIQWGWHNRDYTVTDPYASPAPVPGEHIQGSIPNPDGTTRTPIWHFQDDAVGGMVNVWVNPDDPCNPEVFQDEATFYPAHYVDDVDGPGPFFAPETFPGIGAFSKDLAFELYAIPEPSLFVLITIGLVSVLAFSRRR
jgi:hypothetical protein